MNLITDIPTDVFYAIVAYLKSTDDWQMSIEYNYAFDKGIDFDLYQFNKSDEQLLMAWDNWFEGEIKTSAKNFTWLRTIFQIGHSCAARNYLPIPTY